MLLELGLRLIDLQAVENGPLNSCPAANAIELPVINRGSGPHDALRDGGERRLPFVLGQLERLVHSRCWTTQTIVEVATHDIELSTDGPEAGCHSGRRVGGPFRPSIGRGLVALGVSRDLAGLSGAVGGHDGESSS